MPFARSVCKARPAVASVGSGTFVTLRRRSMRRVPLLLAVLATLAVLPGVAHAAAKACKRLCRPEIAPCITACRADVAACTAGCTGDATDIAACRQSCRQRCGRVCRGPIIAECRADADRTRCRPSDSTTTTTTLPPCADPTTPGCAPPLVGVYAPGRYWGMQSDVDAYLHGLDAWAGVDRTAGTGHAIAADFKDLDDPSPEYNIPVPLETLWTNGYADFINISTSRKSAAIAGGCCDDGIQAWANAYAGWVGQGGGRRAFLAPFPEMNGYWAPWGLDPAAYKSAFQRIQDIFASAGVTRDMVWWVFAPNGYTEPGDPPLPAYYPGDDKVDVIAFSGYNFGKCAAAPQKRWDAPPTVFGPYIDLIRAQVSAVKPLFIAQTATTSTGGDKDQWLADAYTYLAQQNVRAILYFNADKECDWAVYEPGGRALASYPAALAAAGAQYVPPLLLGSLIHDLP